MADMDVLALQPTTLRDVTLVGPEIGKKGTSSRPLWMLSAGSPHFGFWHASDGRGDYKAGGNADHMHPLRVLSADPPKGNAARPRLLSVHLVLGATGPHYKKQPQEHGLTTLLTSAPQTVFSSSQNATYLRTLAEPGDSVQPAAPFVQIVGEPLLPNETDWPAFQAGLIRVPPLRLVAGRVPIEAKVARLGSVNPNLSWLRKLGIVPGKDPNWSTVWLTPDGIEFVAELPFPAAPAKLKARVLLAEAKDKPDTITLSFLEVAGDDTAEIAANREAWLRAWRAITPAGDAEDALHGLKFAARRDGHIPAFRWTVVVAGNVPTGLAQAVEIPGEAVRFELVSPAENDVVDGVARLRPEWVTAAASNGVVTFAFATAGATLQGPALSITSNMDDGNIVQVAADQPFSLDIDVMRLATDLRAAYGIEPPPLLRDVDPNVAAGPGFERPLLAAFVPLADGWVQLPVPNLGPIDVDDIAFGVSPPGGGAASILDGFFRVKRVGASSRVLSAYRWTDPPALSEEAPWSVTIERATGVACTVETKLEPSTAVVPFAVLRSAVTRLHGAALSTRGFIWVSADRPDVQEALPRVGAGPGAFLDIALEGTVNARPANPTPESVALMGVDVAALTIKATRNAVVTSELSKVSMGVTFNAAAAGWQDLLAPRGAREALSAACEVVVGTREILVDGKQAPWPAVVWRRHPTLPLAAEMPMTRVAAGAVRPLESRDLMPFALGSKPDGEAKWKLTLVELTKTSGAAFPTIAAATFATDKIVPVAQWPRADGADRPERGIAFAALGVPGMELRPATPKAGIAYEGAVRYDLPALDEAFSTAPLPPLPDGRSGVDEREAEKPRPVATALDWPLLGAFWQEQERKHQNARVSDSYLSPFAPTDGAGSVTVNNLVRNLEWASTVEVGTAVSGDEVPYGHVAIGTTGKVNGNAALLGYSGRFAISGKTLTPIKLPDPIAPPKPGEVDVLGFSPSTFRKSEGGFELDNSQMGAGVAVLSGDGAMMSRPVAVPDMADCRLVSLVRREEVTIAAKLGDTAATASFLFWFKDVLVDQNGNAQLPAATVAFDVWDDDARLAGSGFEWRFAPVGEPDRSAAFRRGRDEIPFFGFRLEPLRLMSLTVQGEHWTSAKIACRLGLGPRGSGSAKDENIITLNLSRTSDGTLVPQFDPCPLRYALDVKHDAGGARSLQRSVTLAARLQGGKALAVEPKSLTVAVAQTPIVLGSPAITLQTRRIPDVSAPARDDIVIVTAKAQDPKLIAGEAALTLREVQIETGYRLSPPPGGDPAGRLVYEDLPPTFTTFKRRVAILPKQPNKDLLPNPKKAVLSWEEGHRGAPDALSLFAAEIAPTDVDWEEGEGVITVRTSHEIAILGVAGLLGVGLVARLGSSGQDGAVKLTSGHAEGDIVQSSPFVSGGLSLDEGRLRFTLSTGLRDKAHDAAETAPDAAWSGTAVVSGKLKVLSEIGWPSLAWAPDPPVIPVPEEKPNSNTGRVTVKPGANGETSHHVTWSFAEHRLSAALAGAIAEGAKNAVWATPVTAYHELTRAGAPTLAWTSIETVAVGASTALVPPFDGSNAAFEQDATIFAARYRDNIKNGKAETVPVPGMHLPGKGAMATVLQGALGAAFRQAFWAGGTGQGARLMIAGGFLGSVKIGGAMQSAPLLRLPVLFGTGSKMRQSAIPTTGIELSWTDGPAARALAPTRPGAPSPANASLDAITAAMHVGSRSFEGLGSEESFDEMVPALLVEQSILHANFGAGASLDTTPFFLASAVGVEKMMTAAAAAAKNTANLGETGGLRTEALSLVAGSVARRDAKGAPGRPRALAAALMLRNAVSRVAAPLAAARLVVLGEDVTIDDWTGPEPSQSSASLASLVTGLAIARHAVPRASMIVWHPDGAAKAAAFWPRPLRGTTLEEPAVLPAASPAFADHGRGTLASPTVGKPPGAPAWLFPIVEGAVRPVRDDRGDLASGLSGLTRRMALPAQNGMPATIDGENAAAPDLVWLSQTQVPAYLRLLTNEMVSPPIGWLTPAPPRVRLPADADVLGAVRATRPAADVPEKNPAVKWQVQPFLPAEIGGASVGERAGVVTVRRTRLIGSLPGDVTTYDPVSSRFGRPAQAGSSFARKLRTPRPGPLPINTGDRARDRRVHASSLFPTDACAAFIGSADFVEGEASQKIGAWSIKVIAAPEIESTVSDRWDGTVRLICRLEVESLAPEVKPAPPTDTPVRCLGRLLLPLPDKATPQTPLESRALLKIGERAIPYRWLAVPDQKPEWVHIRDGRAGSEGGEPKETKSVHRADVAVILDPRDSELRALQPVPHPAIAAALAVFGPLPPIEVQWTVHPSSERPSSALATKQNLRLTVVDQEHSEFAKGEDRAPLTLRLPLYPATAERGALPLTPATLLFGDPAYDRDLASAPAESGIIVPLSEEAKKALQRGRGALRAVLMADRARINRRGVVTFMADLRYEKLMSELDQARAEPSVSPGGDLMQTQGGEANSTELRISLQPRTAPPRPLRLGKDLLMPAWGLVYELPLAALTELNGDPAQLVAGDMLVLDLAMPVGEPIKKIALWNSEIQRPSEVPLILSDMSKPLTLTLHLMLTDEPVAEPPPALYAALLRTNEGTAEEPKWRLAVPLHAQSPVPHRVDLIAPARDFRKGMMRRRANFIWTLLRPRRDFTDKALTLIKSDRNGQTYLPEKADEFIAPERLS